MLIKYIISKGARLHESNSGLMCNKVYILLTLNKEHRPAGSGRKGFMYIVMDGKRSRVVNVLNLFTFFIRGQILPKVLLNLYMSFRI